MTRRRRRTEFAYFTQDEAEMLVGLVSNLDPDRYRSTRAKAVILKAKDCMENRS